MYLEGQPPSDVKVTANVALRSLRLLSVETEGDITCIEFGPTYYGTDVVESCLLCNDSPDEVSFVVILEEDGEGQEIVSCSFPPSFLKIFHQFLFCTLYNAYVFSTRNLHTREAVIFITSSITESQRIYGVSLIKCFKVLVELVLLTSLGI